MTAKLKRPGEELTGRILRFFWIVDCSYSMLGEKIDTLNHAIKSVIPSMKDEADNNPNARLMVRALKFSDGAVWVDGEPIPIDDYSWNDLKADGLTAMGSAFELLKSQLTMPPMSDRELPPVLVLLSDGYPTDEYKKSLNDLLSLPWGKKAVKVAVAIGKEADEEVLTEFTKNPEMVFHANNPEALVKCIKWASTLATQVTSPDSTPKDAPSNNLNLKNLPTPSGDEEEVW